MLGGQGLCPGAQWRFKSQSELRLALRYNMKLDFGRSAMLNHASPSPASDYQAPRC
jgi:hypothetical protein